MSVCTHITLRHCMRNCRESSAAASTKMRNGSWCDSCICTSFLFLYRIIIIFVSSASCMTLVMTHDRYHYQHRNIDIRSHLLLLIILLKVLRCVTRLCLFTQCMKYARYESDATPQTANDYGQSCDFCPVSSLNTCIYLYHLDVPDV